MTLRSVADDPLGDDARRRRDSASALRAFASVSAAHRPNPTSLTPSTTPPPAQPLARPRQQTVTLQHGHKTVAHLAVSFVGLDSSASAVPYLASWAESAAADTFERIAALVDRLARRLENALGAEQASQPAAATAA